MKLNRATISPVVTYGSDRSRYVPVVIYASWILTGGDIYALKIIEREIIFKIYGAIKDKA